jgi:hypothetical protein
MFDFFLPFVMGINVWPHHKIFNQPLISPKIDIIGVLSFWAPYHKLQE